jgi:hypothetical protein
MTDAIDSALLEHDQVRPRTHQTIGEHDVPREKEIPKITQHSQLALALAGVAADS